MDYKELITEIRTYIVKTYQVGFQPEICQRAADAIETILAERDAAVNEMRGICSFCAHKKTCQFGNHLRDICVNGSNWQWRGPQKGGGA